MPKPPAFKSLAPFVCAVLFSAAAATESRPADTLFTGFQNPPHTAKPGVYWFVMDGNLNPEGITKDFEAMKKAGLEHIIHMEVNQGVPRGTADLLSEPWLQGMKHAVKEAGRLGIDMTLAIGPGWCGSGGPWVKPEKSMQHLVYSKTQVTGNGRKQTIDLPVPPPKKTLRVQAAKDFYQDAAVLAFPAPEKMQSISAIDEKALYSRTGFFIDRRTIPYILPAAEYPDLPAVASRKMIDLTGQFADGKLTWDVPEGKWIVMRFGSRNSGSVTTPAPQPGFGMESDKLNAGAVREHLDTYLGKIFNVLGTVKKEGDGGLKTLHIDSWEVGAQNWSENFREEFIKRRGYDPQPYYPVYAGIVIDSTERSERFLWDLRFTAQELLVENHVLAVKEFGRKYGLTLSIEPYDQTPAAEMEMACAADLPMAEFWSQGFGGNCEHCVAEATSAAHLLGQPAVPAESFTSGNGEGWKMYPGALKNQGDWAFANGINRFIYHVYQHQPLDDRLKPGMTMGRWGVSWNRHNTWWEWADTYHAYIARCQFLLQQGRTAADILYLTLEGSPCAFVHPQSAMDGTAFLPDRKGYNFDGCPPGMLSKAVVKEGKIVFPSGAKYEILVLPSVAVMTPELLAKIKSLVNDGAAVMGVPPKKSPSLVNYPKCDEEVRQMAAELWGTDPAPQELTVRKFGKGKIVWCSDMAAKADNLYPHYDLTAAYLKNSGLAPDCEAAAGTINTPRDLLRDSDISPANFRYTHRTTEDAEIYFVSNRTNKKVSEHIVFRVSPDAGYPEVWNPLTGKKEPPPQAAARSGQWGPQMHVSLYFEPYQSFFVIFRKGNPKPAVPAKTAYTVKTEPEFKQLSALTGSWNVSFDPERGGPENVVFDALLDWSKHTEPGIRYYSGKAIYTKEFDCPADALTGKVFLDFGSVKNMARVTLNGKDLGVIWTYPWRADVSGLLKPAGNRLQVEVINLWVNRLIGDEQLPEDGIAAGKFPDWVLKGEKRPTGRLTFATWKHYTKDSPLQESGLLGPVTVIKETEGEAK
ncbi:MAG: hypothetical protein LBH00_05535 [Planctomycetaceae bacterium]|jgi:hypothetical protein|nr:hypothetical protein [Planctomycetaceae bacterium]